MLDSCGYFSFCYFSFSVPSEARMLWQFILAISLAIVAFSMPSMNRRSLLLAKNGTENNTTNQIKVPRISNNEWESRLQTILFEDNKNDVHPDTCENGTSCPVTVIFDAQLIRILKVVCLICYYIFICFV